MKVATYLRKSVKGDENSISIEAQLEIIKDYFKKDNCTFVVYKDDGFSGGTTNRPAFKKMMDDAKYSAFDVVACYKLDRMSRNTLDFLTTFEALKELGTDLVCVNDNYDPRTPAGKMMMTLLASLAEMERENIKRRAIDGMFSLARQGRWSGGHLPYGCKPVTIDGGRYLEIEKVDEIKYIYSQFSCGKSLNALSKELNLTPRTLGYMIKNPLYIISDDISHNYLTTLGYTVLGEPNGNGYMSYKHNKNNNDKNKLVNLAVISKNKGIIPSNLWIQTREKLRSLQSMPPRISGMSWLAHKVVCSKCGKTLFVGVGTKRNDGSRLFYFRCKKKCTRFLRVDFAEEKVFTSLKNFKLEDLIKNESNNEDLTAYKSLNRAINSKQKMMNGLIDKSALASDQMAQTMLNRAEKIFNEIEELKKRLLNYEIVAKNSKNNADELKQREKIKKKFIKDFNRLSMEQKQSLIEMILDKCEWDGDNITLC